MIDGSGQRWGRDGALARLSVVAALWTLIAVALLSALAPLGPPLSRITGSAFNPATSDVMLKTRAFTAPQAVQTPHPDGDGVPPATALIALALACVAAWHVRPAATPGRAYAVPRPNTPQRRRRARAPPLLP